MQPGIRNRGMGVGGEHRSKVFEKPEDKKVHKQEK